MRGSETTADVAYLKAMPGAERLKLFYGVDLLIDGSYDAAMVGCSSVHHVASPFYMTGSKKNIQNKLIDPAIKGTENVLAKLQPDAHRQARRRHRHGPCRRL